MITQQGEAQITKSAADRGRRAAMIILAIKIAVACLILAGVVAGAAFPPLRNWLRERLVEGLEWTQGLGVWGPVFVVAFYIVACILFIPGSILTLGAGFLFKVVKGTITVSIGSTLGACAAFLVGRFFARAWISHKVEATEKFAAIDKAVGQQGFKIVLLTRLSPIFPFNLLNYAFGLTRVSFWKYVLASWIGMIPGTIMYVYFGATMRSLADIAAGKVETGRAGQVFFWLGMGATIVVTVFVTRIARRAIKEAVDDSKTN